MSSQFSGHESGLLGTVDFRAFFETLRLRWWILPTIIGLSVGFLQAQKSDLRTQPETFVISRGYDLGLPNRALSALGVETGVIEFPEQEVQSLILASAETREKVAQKIGKDIPVSLPKDWEPPIVFTCNQPVREDCVQAIEAYVEQAAEIRTQALRSGIKTVKDILVAKQEINEDPLLVPKVAALQALEKNLNVQVVQVNSSEQSIGATVNDVGGPTVLIGAAAGFFISILILLQLTYSDSRVRSIRQLVRLTGPYEFLGSLGRKAEAVRDRRVALGLHCGLSATSANRIRFLPLRGSLDTESLIRVAEMAEVQHTLADPFIELSVPELAGANPDEADVLIVQRNKDLRKDVLDALQGIQRSERHLIGVLLVD
ncbi:MAG: hypothetical protein RL072_1220 [Actinomycetota bacterium]|jgi:hypothetical protein